MKGFRSDLADVRDRLARLRSEAPPSGVLHAELEAARERLERALELADGAAGGLVPPVTHLTREQAAQLAAFLGAMAPEDLVRSCETVIGKDADLAKVERELRKGLGLMETARAGIVRRVICQLDMQAGALGGGTLIPIVTPAEQARRDAAAPPAPAAAPTPAARPRDPRLPPLGGIVSRIYRGRRYVAIVREDGFEYRGKTFPTLSGLASHITGNKGWNGFLFFNLQKHPPHRNRQAGAVS